MSGYDRTRARAGTGVQESVERSFETPDKVELRVQNTAGKVEIETHDLAVTEVRVVSLHPTADDLVRGALISGRSSPGGYEISVEIPKARGRARYWFGDEAGVGVQVLLPRDSAIEVATASASVSARGSYRAAEVDTASGVIALEETAGAAKIRTAGGSVEIGSVGGAVNVHTASGDVRVGHVAAGGKVATASGDVELGRVERPLRVRSISGDVSVGEALQGSSIETVSGDLRVERAAAGELVLRSVSGSVVVAVVPGSLVRFDAVSMSGRVTSNIEVEPSRPSAGGRDHFAELSIQSKSVRGEISVLRTAP